MNRREFISWVGIGGIVSSLPIAIAACTPKAEDSQAQGSPSTPGQSPSAAGSPRADGFLPVGTVATLTQAGSIADEKSPIGSLLVIQNPANPSQVIAVNPTCPHAGCAVAWNKAETSFVCPCHGSKFASSGAVQQGPADKPLATYTAKIEGDEILVKGS
jgi:cytochrome b6-f complex iron-sulfur subunit